MTKNHSQKTIVILEPVKSIMHPNKLTNPKGWQELLAIAIKNNEAEVVLNCSNYGNIIMTRKTHKHFKYFESKESKLGKLRLYLPEEVVIKDASLKTIPVDESDDMKKINQNSKDFFNSSLTVRFKIIRSIDKIVEL
ncbi:MAG: hypothetical protein WCP91_00310 [Candidatus Berkelbacteria bacterium]